MKIRTAYGQVIARIRAERHLTLKQAAALAHISPSYLHEVEKGKKEASSEYLGAILTALEVPPTEFFTGVAAFYRKGPDVTRGRLDSDEQVRA